MNAPWVFGTAGMALALLAAPAQAETLRMAEVSLAGMAVHLSDLFDGVAHDREIGPAPGPGGRIVVESAQLAAIARQFGVDWRPATTADRVVLTRPGQQFPREPVLAGLRDALLAVGMPANSEIETPALNLPMVPPGDGARPDVTQAAYDPATGRFTALLSITAEGMAPFNARMSGHVQEIMDVEVATRRLAAGTVLSAEDVQMARVRAGLVRSEPARLPEQVVGLALRHAVNAGAPMALAELEHPTIVQRGSSVQMQLDLPGLSMTVQGLAMEPAALGERVHVLNPTSRAVMEGEVVAADRVRVNSSTGTVILPPGASVPRPLPTRVAGR
jgi:flagella basal body P-ring formation protein FlgA